MTLQEKIAEGDSAVMCILMSATLDNNRFCDYMEMPSGMSLRWRKDHPDHKVYHIELSVGKTPTDDGGYSIVAYRSDRGWMAEGPWRDMFHKWAEKVMKKHEKKIKEYAALWAASLEFS